MSGIKELELESEVDDALATAKSSDTAVVLQFSASWCAPCRRITPHIKEASGSMPSVKFYKIDVDAAEEELVEKYGVKGLPTFVVFGRDGNKVSTYVGAKWEKLKQLIESASPPSTTSTTIPTEAAGAAATSVAPGVVAGAGVGAGAGAGGSHGRSVAAKRERDNNDTAPERPAKQSRSSSGSVELRPSAMQERAATLDSLARVFETLRKDFVPRVGSLEEARALYTYPVPKPAVDGTCSASTELEQFSLAPALGVNLQNASLSTFSQTIRLARLKAVCSALAAYVGAEWCGVYRVVPHNGGSALLKEAYVGEPSRAYFPLTTDFAVGSNNSTVAMSNIGVVIPDTQAMDDDAPYYECSSKVRSEVCVPISEDGEECCVVGAHANAAPPGVIGILDIEAWRPNHFQDAHIAAILYVCRQLAAFNMFQ